MHPNYLFILTFQHIYSRVYRFRNIKILQTNEVNEMTFFFPPPPLTKEVLIWYKVNELMLWGGERERVGLSLKWSYTRLNVSGWGGGDPPPACSAKGGGHAYGAGEGWLDTPPPDYWGATSFWHASQSDLQFKMEKLPQKYFLRF